MGQRHSCHPLEPVIKGLPYPNNYLNNMLKIEAKDLKKHDEYTLKYVSYTGVNKETTYLRFFRYNVNSGKPLEAILLSNTLEYYDIEGVTYYKLATGTMIMGIMFMYDDKNNFDNHKSIILVDTGHKIVIENKRFSRTIDRVKMLKK